VAPYYAQFDAHYAASKFILTVREKEPWLRSCETHWRLMAEWLDNFPNFKRVQEFASASTYGTVGFSRERFSFAYDLHVRNVSDYFKARSNDFLLLDICGGEGWEKLCAFLGVAVPDLPFPHVNEWMHLWQQAADDVARLVPEGETLILVDEQGFGKDFARGRRCLPFLEREGGYWGAPPDGATAVSEFERLRSEGGANFIAFGWPAFWWLKHYDELNAHLRSRFNCVAENPRIIVFDLRATNNYLTAE